MVRFCVVIFLILSASCKSTKEISTITFGSGGGFAGSFQAYQLDRSGDLAKISLDETKGESFKTLNKPLTTQIFNNVKLFGIDTMNYNNPQNLYYFIKYKNGNDSNYVSWSGKPTGTLVSVHSIYQLLMSQTKSAVR